MNQKTILILTIRFGAGHRRVAEALSNSCAREFPAVDARVVDVTPCMPWWIRWVYVDLYLLVLKYAPSLWRRIEGVQRKQPHTFPPELLQSTADRLYRQVKEWNIDAIISSEDSKVKVLAVPTNEEQVIIEDTLRLVSLNKK